MSSAFYTLVHEATLRQHERLARVSSLEAVNPSLPVVQYFRGEVKREQASVARGTSPLLLGNLSCVRAHYVRFGPAVATPMRCGGGSGSC